MDMMDVDVVDQTVHEGGYSQNQADGVKGDTDRALAQVPQDSSNSDVDRKTPAEPSILIEKSSPRPGLVISHGDDHVAVQREFNS